MKNIIPSEKQINKAADNYVFGSDSKWSNNNDECGDNLGSFKKGANWVIKKLTIVKNLAKIFKYANQYNITIQFWGDNNTNVFIEKGNNSIELTDFGGLSPEEALEKTVEYLDKINKKS